MPVSPQEFLDRLRLGVMRSGEAEWVAGRVHGEAVVVLFRRDEIQGTDVDEGPLTGVRLVFDEFAAAVLGPGEHGIDDVLPDAVLEVIEPHRPGMRLDVPWADGLCSRPDEVLWLGDAVAAAARAGASRNARPSTS